MSKQSTKRVPEPFKLLNGVGDLNTKLVLKDETGTHEYFGPVFSSKLQKPTDREGTPYWIDQIFVSDLPNKQKAYEAAYALAKEKLKTDKPWHTLDSSPCGLAATLHVVGALPVPIAVTRMVTNADDPLENKPKVIAVAAWKRQDMMTSFEVADFNATAKAVTRAMGVLGMRLDDPKPLKPSAKSSRKS